jgi:hypothetical protein
MVTIRNDTLKHYKSQLPSETMYVSVIVLTKRFQEEKLTLDNTYKQIPYHGTCGYDYHLKTGMFDRIICISLGQYRTKAL